MNIKTQINAINMQQELALDSMSNRFSSTNIELRGNNNISNSLENSLNRDVLINRYTNAKYVIFTIIPFFFISVLYKPN